MKKKIFSEDAEHSVLCSINFDDKEVTVSSEYYEPLICLLKKEKLLWDPYRKLWYMDIDLTTGDAIDRAVEIGNNLLNAGYIVEVEENIMESVINAVYEPRYERWVMAAKDKKFAIRWEHGADQVYKDALKLPQAKYSHGRIYVPVSSWEAVLEFAQVYNFRISPDSEEMIKDYKSNIIVVKPKKAKQITYTDNKNKIEDILKSSMDVLQDLKDDE